MTDWTETHRATLERAAEGGTSAWEPFGLTTAIRAALAEIDRLQDARKRALDDAVDAVRACGHVSEEADHALEYAVKRIERLKPETR